MNRHVEILQLLNGDTRIEFLVGAEVDAVITLTPKELERLREQVGLVSYSYDEGYDDGHTYGYDAGYREGCDEGYAQALRDNE